MTRRLAIGLVLALLAPAGGAWAGGESSGSTPEQVAYGAGSVLGTLVYAPVKASFCILGGIGSGFTYLADSKTAAKVARASCGGTWIITPSAVAGKESVHFVGNTEPSGADRTHVAGAPPTRR